MEDWPEAGAESPSPPIRVGAILLLLSLLVSSTASEAALSRLTPATDPGIMVGAALTEWPGVCGGVNSGIPAALEPAAVMDGTLLIEGVGLFMMCAAFWSGGCAKLDCVPTLDVDMLRAGEAGRAMAVNGDGVGPGGGAMAPVPTACPEGGRGIEDTMEAVGAVGVACGVDTAELLAFDTDIGVGVARATLGGG